MAYRVSKYFLGETTQAGFKSSFDQQIQSDGYYTYILKGFPGCGKSEIIQKIALAFCDKDNLELFGSFVDPCSPDAVVLENAKVIVVDAAPPHSFEASYPGAFQSLVNLEECFEKDILLERQSEIKSLTDEVSLGHARCKRYLTAFASLNGDIHAIAKGAVNYEKLDGFIQRTTKKFIPKGGSDGKIRYKNLSALTVKGYHTMPSDLYENQYILNDSFFAASDYFLQQITDAAVSRGYDVIVSLSAHFSEALFEHIVIPELQLAFFSSNPVTGLTLPYPPINFPRFYEKSLLSAKKNRIDFSRKAAQELKEEAVASLKYAQQWHEQLKVVYADALNPQQLQGMTDSLLRQIARQYRAAL